METFLLVIVVALVIVTCCLGWALSFAIKLLRIVANGLANRVQAQHLTDLSSL
jgi:hypothetical protein